MVIKEIDYTAVTSARETAAKAADRREWPERLAQHLASPIDRLAASIADLVIFLPVVAVVIAPFRRQALEAELLSSQAGWTEAVISAVIASVMTLVLYQTVSIYLWQATPGKRLFGLRVVPIWSERQPLRLWSIFLRSVMWTLEIALLGMPWIAIFGNERRRPLHDRVGDSVVISTRKGASFGPPNWRELSMASGLMLGFLIAASGLIVTEVYNLKSAGLADAAGELEDEGALCSSVGDAQRNWIPQHGQKPPSRIAIALALFASDSIDEDCLAQESELEFWRGKDRSSAYLAKGLSFTGNDHRRKDYLQKACAVDSESDACLSARLIIPSLSAVAAKSDPNPGPNSKQVLASLGPGSNPFVLLWATDALMKQKQFDQALQVITLIPPQASLAFVLAREKSEILWHLDQKPEARQILQYSIGSLAPEERMELSKWFCTSETDRDGCSPEAVKECGLLSDVVNRFPEWTSKPDVAATYLRGASCNRKIGEVVSPDLKANLPQGSSRTLLHALYQYHDGEREQAENAIRDLARADDDDPVTLTARWRLIEWAESPTDLEIARRLWLKGESFAETASDEWLWQGQRLMDRFAALGAAGSANQIAGLLRSHANGEGANLVERPDSPDNRRPASTNQ